MSKDSLAIQQCTRLHTHTNTHFTWNARSWYFCFSLGPKAYHHSPRILLTVRLSWLGCRWWTRARWRLLKIMKAFMGLRIWSFSLYVWRSISRMGESFCLSEESQTGSLLFCTGVCCVYQTLPGLFLSSLGSALRDWERRFPDDAETGGSGRTPGKNLKTHTHTRQPMIESLPASHANVFLCKYPFINTHDTPSYEQGLIQISLSFMRNSSGRSAASLWILTDSTHQLVTATHSSTARLAVWKCLHLLLDCIPQ